MIKIYSPSNEVELAFIKGILESEGIPYFVHNDHFGSLRPGFIIHLFNEKNIYVERHHVTQAKLLIQDFIDGTHTEFVKDSLADRVRMALEATVFMCCVPGKGWKKGFPKEDIIPIIFYSSLIAIALSQSVPLIANITDYLHHYFKYKFYY